LQTAPTATSNQSERGNAKFFVTVLEQQGGDDSGNSADMCRYEMILSNDAAVLATHYFDYDLADGEVIITKPNLN
jgi:hypothetical protein